MEEKNIVGLEAPEPKDTLAERKARIKREGDFYRVGIVRSKAYVKQGAKPENLFHAAVDHATWAVRNRVDAVLRPTGINVATIMPYAVTVLGLLRRKGLVKPAIGIVTAVAGAAYYYQQRRAGHTPALASKASSLLHSVSSLLNSPYLSLPFVKSLLFR